MRIWALVVYVWPVTADMCAVVASVWDIAASIWADTSSVCITTAVVHDVALSVWDSTQRLRRRVSRGYHVSRVMNMCT